MSKKRRKGKTGGGGAAARGGASARGGFSYRFRSLATPYLLALMTALLMSLAFPPFEISWVAYAAPVPLLLMATATRSPRAVFRAAWVGGVVFFGTNVYWLLPITAAGWAVAVVYLGAYWGVFGWLVRRVRDVLPRVPLTLSAPVVWVGLEWFRGWFVTALPWLYLGHTQYENLVLIQTADVVGAYGASFLVMMTGGLAADLLTRPLVVLVGGEGAGTPVAAGGRRVSPLAWGMVGLTAAAWAGTVGYGVWRLGQETRRAGPVVATVQTCVPQEVKLGARLSQDRDLEQEMLDAQVLLTREVLADLKSAGEKADLVAWPETMVPGMMNEAFLEADLGKRIEEERLRKVFAFLQERSRGYWGEILALAKEAEAPILFGASGTEIEGAMRLPGGRFMTKGPRWNTAFLMTPESTAYAAAHTYSKAHLVPFGEVVPFKESWPWLHERLMALTPYDYDYTLTPGARDQAPFEIGYREAGGAEGKARFQVAICYEDAMAYRIAEMARGAPGKGKAIDFLVNISNDGWFNGSTELDQHLNLCVFRAVENRIAIVRSVNTGISALIGSDGRIEKVVADGTGNRRYIAGKAWGRLALDDRRAPYTALGDVFAKVCLMLAAGALGWLVWARRRARRSAAGGAPVRKAGGA